MPDMFVFRPFVSVVTVPDLIHWSPCLASWSLSFCLCYAAVFVSCGLLVDVRSIAAWYSPRRAARLHLAR